MTCPRCNSTGAVNIARESVPCPSCRFRELVAAMREADRRTALVLSDKNIQRLRLLESIVDEELKDGE